MLKKWRKFSLLLSIILTVAYSSVSKAQTPTFDLHEKSFRCHFAEGAKESLGDLSSDEFRQMSREAFDEVTLALEGDELSRREKKILKEHLKLLKSLEKIEDPKSEIVEFYTKFCLSTDSVFRGGIKGVAHASNVINLTVTFPARFLARFIVGLNSGAETTIAPMGVNDILGNKRITSVGYFFLYRAYSVALGSNPLLAPLLAVPLVNALILRVCTEGTHLSDKDQKFCDNFFKTKMAFFNAANVGQKWGATLRNKEPHSPPSPWREEIRDDNLCEYLFNVSETKTAKFKAEEFREALISSLNPGYMAKPDTKVTLTSDELFIKQNVSSFPKLRNIIVSLAPPEDQIKKMKSTGSWDAYNQLQKELSNQRKIFNKLYRQKDLNKCRQLKIKKKFDFAYYASLKQKLEAFKNESLYDQHLIVENQFKSLSSKFNLFNSTQLKWELIPSNTLNTVKELLQQSNVGNLIIITHSVGDYKKMIDSTFTQYPSTYFGSISPDLMSLSFYTCHSENILETYDLAKVLEGTPSIHKKKILNFVQENNILEDGEQVPLKGFTDFLMKVDSSLSFTIQENLMSQAFSSNPLKENTEKKCFIEIPMKKPTSGSLSLILNRQFIGNINRFDSKTIFEFNCSLLKQKNTLLLQNSALIEKLAIDAIPEAILINGENILNLDWKNFFDLNGFYSSSKIKF